MARQQGDYQQNMEDVRRNIRRVVDWFRRYPLSLFLLILLLIAMLTAPSMIYQVNAQERGVVLRFGKFVRVEKPGLQYKMPYPLERVRLINTQKPFEMSFSVNEQNRSPRRNSSVSSRRSPDEQTLMLTGDLGVARVEWQIQYKKSDPVKYLFNVNDREHRHLIRETTLATMRRIIGDKFVTRVITVARTEIRQAVEKELQEVLDQYNTGITIDGIEIQSTEPPVQSVIDAFKEVDSARQDRETYRNQALEQKEKVINESKGKANKRESEAEGRAAAIRNEAYGEAERFEFMLEEFESAPRITRTRMYLDTMEDVLKDSDRVYIIDRNVKGLLPHLQLQEGGK